VPAFLILVKKKQRRWISIRFTGHAEVQTQRPEETKLMNSDARRVRRSGVAGRRIEPELGFVIGCSGWPAHAPRRRHFLESES